MVSLPNFCLLLPFPGAELDHDELVTDGQMFLAEWSWLP